MSSLEMDPNLENDVHTHVGYVAARGLNNRSEFCKHQNGGVSCTDSISTRAAFFATYLREELGRKKKPFTLYRM